MKDFFLIMNPGSHSGQSSKAFDQILSLMEQSDLDFGYQLTKSLEDALDLSVYANLNGYKKIVAVGGDGTINAVVNGFFDKNGKLLSQALFGVIYTGTSPDFNKSYQLPLDIPAAVNTFRNGASMLIP